MPRIIEYNFVQQRMNEAGFVSLYYNSGAFGFALPAEMKTVGWIGPDDPSIREAAKQWVRSFPPPYETNLAAAFVSARRQLPGDAWLMPKSHWHYEMHFGNEALLNKVLPRLGLDPVDLRDRNNGSAIEFSADEGDLLKQTVEHLLAGLSQSDFLIAFPEAKTLCTIHHHKQLWWQTTNPAIVAVTNA